MERELLIGDRYRLLDRLGSGGMSVVWRARDEVLDREVAIKVLSAAPAADPELTRRIYAEARAAAGLRHPNVVAVYDYGETTQTGESIQTGESTQTGESIQTGETNQTGETQDDGRAVPYVVMELVAGRSLSDLLSGGALPWRSAVLIGAQVAAALAAAHGHGIVHRDVKPGNVMVTASGVKLVDFGISAAIGEADGSDGELLGTPAYLAPERLDGGQVRPATDVYALGLLLYLSLAGHLPWQVSTTTQMIRAHKYQEPSVLPPVTGLPPEVADLVHRALAKDPADRPSAVDAAEELGEAVGLPQASLLMSAASRDVDSIAEEDTRAGTTLSGLGRRRPGLVLVAGGVVAALTLGGVAAWSAAGSGTDPKAVAAPMATRAGCTVDYAIRSAAAGKSSTAVTIRNTGEVPVDGWTLSFTLPGQQQLVRGWNNRWQQTGTDVLASGGALPAGASVATGFDALYRDVAALPARFLLNGTACQPVLSVRNPPTSPAVSKATATKAATKVTKKATPTRDRDLGRSGRGKGHGHSGRGHGGGD